MKRVLLLLLACVLSASAAEPQTPSRPDNGTFIGLEPIPDLHEQPGDHWFHENTLTIKGNKVTLSKEPVVFYQGKKLDSASTGGFYTYRGTLSLVNGGWQVKLRLTESDYEEDGPAGKKGKAAAPKSPQFVVVRASDGSLQIDKVTYKKSKHD